MNLQQELHIAYEHGKTFLGQGKLADYIPILAQADSNHPGICITTVDGTRYCEGDWAQYFTFQSMAKVIVLATALVDSGIDETFSRVGMEPTGDSFHSIARLETTNPKPANPMINAGAIALYSLIRGNTKEDRFVRLKEMSRTLLCKDSITYDHAAFHSERATGDKNRALAYMMRANGVFQEEPKIYWISTSKCPPCWSIARIFHPLVLCWPIKENLPSRKSLSCLVMLSKYLIVS
ncbi:MAG: glutaminase [Eubacteriales bacterium]